MQLCYRPNAVAHIIAPHLTNFTQIFFSFENISAVELKMRSVNEHSNSEPKLLKTGKVLSRNTLFSLFLWCSATAACSLPHVFVL